jgi:predicted lysophospholipase L1 biosynthesis ABC-type transport system permease subunit
MGPSAHRSTTPRTARFCILTIFYQDDITFHFRVYIFGATAVVFLLYLLGVIPYSAFLTGLTIGAILVAALIWLLILARKEALLNIRDPELKELAHEAMLIYIFRKRLSPPEKEHLKQRLESTCRSKRC